MLMTVLNTLFLVAYVLSAGVQLNDPDPWAWVVIYLASAGMCIAWFRGALSRWVPVTLMVVSLVWIGTLVPALERVPVADIFSSLGMKTRAVEEAREIGGLALVSIWSAVLAKRLR